MEWRRFVTGYKSALSLVVIPTGGFIGAMIQIFRSPDHISANVVTLFVVMMFGPAVGRLVDMFLHPDDESKK